MQSKITAAILCLNLALFQGILPLPVIDRPGISGHLWGGGSNCNNSHFNLTSSPV